MSIRDFLHRFEEVDGKFGEILDNGEKVEFYTPTSLWSTNSNDVADYKENHLKFMGMIYQSTITDFSPLYPLYILPQMFVDFSFVMGDSVIIYRNKLYKLVEPSKKLFYRNPNFNDALIVLRSTLSYVIKQTV